MRNVIVEKSFDFAVAIVKLTRKLCKISQDYELAKQLLRSGTSIGANVSEAQQAQSRKDFVSKINIALKEAYETRYWLKLLLYVDDIHSIHHKEMIKNIEEIINLLVSIVKTTKENTKENTNANN